jgi:hypothetical protein
MVDASPGVIKSISSGEKFRSNDYRSISAHWYNGQKKTYMSIHQCRSNGETIRKRTDMPPFFPGDSTIQLPTILQSNPATTRPPAQDVTLQRECRPDNLSLEAVFDPLHLGWEVPAQQETSNTTTTFSKQNISTNTKDSPYISENSAIGRRAAEGTPAWSRPSEKTPSSGEAEEGAVPTLADLHPDLLRA